MQKFDAATVGSAIAKLVGDLNAMSPKGLRDLSISGHVSRGYDGEPKGQLIVEVSAKVEGQTIIAPLNVPE